MKLRSDNSGRTERGKRRERGGKKAAERMRKRILTNKSKRGKEDTMEKKG